MVVIDILNGGKKVLFCLFCYCIFSSNESIDLKKCWYFLKILEPFWYCTKKFVFFFILVSYGKILVLFQNSGTILVLYKTKFCFFYFRFFLKNFVTFLKFRHHFGTFKKTFVFLFTFFVEKSWYFFKCSSIFSTLKKIFSFSIFVSYWKMLVLLQNLDTILIL